MDPMSSLLLPEDVGEDEIPTLRDYRNFFHESTDNEEKSTTKKPTEVGKESIHIDVLNWARNTSIAISPKSKRRLHDPTTPTTDHYFLKFTEYNRSLKRVASSIRPVKACSKQKQLLEKINEKYIPSAEYMNCLGQSVNAKLIKCESFVTATHDLMMQQVKLITEIRADQQQLLDIFHDSLT